MKPEEVKWLGLADWLRGQATVTKDQIADYVRANNLDVQEVMRGEPGLEWQEKVARVHNLGRPPRRLVFLHLDGSGHTLPERGVEVDFHAHVRVEHVHGDLLGGLYGVFFGGEGVALLRLVVV